MEALLELTKEDVSVSLEGDVVKINNLKYPAEDSTLFYSNESAMNYKTLSIFFNNSKIADIRSQIDQEDFNFKLPFFKALRAFFTTKDLSAVGSILKTNLSDNVTPIKIYQFPTQKPVQKANTEAFNIYECDEKSLDLENAHKSSTSIEHLNKQYNSLEQTETFLSDTNIDLYQIAKRFTVASVYFKNEVSGIPIILLPKPIHDAPVSISNFFSTFSPRLPVENHYMNEGKHIYTIVKGTRRIPIALCDDISVISNDDVKNVIAAIVTGKETWFDPSVTNRIASEPSTFFKSIAGFLISTKNRHPSINWNCESLIYDPETKNYAELAITFWDELKSHLYITNRKDLIDKLY